MRHPKDRGKPGVESFLATLAKPLFGTGMRTLSYTVNDATRPHSLLVQRLSVVITDWVDVLTPEKNKVLSYFFIAKQYIITA